MCDAARVRNAGGARGSAWAATLKLNECRISRRVREAADDHLWVRVIRAHFHDLLRGIGESFLGKLRGSKHMILGNNDPDETLTTLGWASVRDYAALEVEGRKMILRHYAFRAWNGQHRGAIKLHGHSHGGGANGIRALVLEAPPNAVPFTRRRSASVGLPKIQRQRSARSAPASRRPAG